MNSPLYYDPYQHPPSINTHISPPPTYPNSIDSSSLHYVIRHINYATEQLRHSHRACIHSISSFASEISSLNHNLIAPNFTYQQQQPIIPSTTVLNHSFNHNQFPPVNPQTFVSPSISTHNVTSTIFTPPPLKISTHPNKHPITPQIPPYNFHHVTTEIVDAKYLVPILPIHSDPVSHVVGEQHVFIAEDFDDEAPSNLLLDSTTTFSTETATQWKDETTKSSLISKTTVATELAGETVFSISETDEHATTKKDQVTLLPNSFSEPHDPPLRDSDRFASFTIQSFGAVHPSLVPANDGSINTNLPSPEKKVVFTVTVAETTQQHPFFIFQLPDFPIELFDPGGTTTAFVLNPQDWFPEFLNPCFVVLDPGGDESRFLSPTAIFGNFYSTLPLLVPWDRGKFGVCSLLSLVLDLSQFHKTLSLQWAPWDRGKKIMGCLKVSPAPTAYLACLYGMVDLSNRLVEHFGIGIQQIKRFPPAQF